MAKDSTRDGLYNCDRYRGGKHGEGQYKGWRTVVTATRGRYLGVTHEESWAVATGDFNQNMWSGGDVWMCEERAKK